MFIEPSATTRPILLVEDSHEDFEAALRSLRKSGVENPIWHCVDGESALELLFGRGGNDVPDCAVHPAIILLDLNLPGTNGLEVLNRVKHDSILRRIPVIMLTTSNDERDIEACYDAGANSYIQKPVSYDGLLEALQRMKAFWLDVVMLPRHRATALTNPRK